MTIWGKRCFTFKWVASLAQKLEMRGNDKAEPASCERNLLIIILT